MKLIDWINAGYDSCYEVMKENFSKSADESIIALECTL